MDVAIDILIIAVVGGLSHPIGPFLGAVLFVLMETFAIDLIDRERFNTVIGLVFLLIVLFLARRSARAVGPVQTDAEPGGLSDSIDRWRRPGG